MDKKFFFGFFLLLSLNGCGAGDGDQSKEEKAPPIVEPSGSGSNPCRTADVLQMYCEDPESVAVKRTAGVSASDLNQSLFRVEQDGVPLAQSKLCDSTSGDKKYLTNKDDLVRQKHVFPEQSVVDYNLGTINLGFVRYDLGSISLDVSTLWHEGHTLYWDFVDGEKDHPHLESEVLAPDTGQQDELLQYFHTAIDLWGDNAPILFKKSSDGDVDFEIGILADPNSCSPDPCVAEAFYPTNQKEYLVFAQNWFSLSSSKKLEVFAHELGHIFGLAHIFAPEEEDGEHYYYPEKGARQACSIMNYDESSPFANLQVMTDQDRDDLGEIYRRVWARALLPGEFSYIDEIITDFLGGVADFIGFDLGLHEIAPDSYLDGQLFFLLRPPG